ncbi:uncharacterized protein A4U43_C01F5640 [Asparagus officinalis]|uniref:BSD domain-containing protein n=1 Tax=Asparagus officinalis TaxID=4686 RepID=A0A5P1FPL1_ASPOF|nr:uncharacterized protein LOC109849222 [Asparagus officinalis]ONK79367.1 uncharacterized protein A4U43_C01F5640 [Asparagus officinalis]
MRPCQARSSDDDSNMIRSFRSTEGIKSSISPPLFLISDMDFWQRARVFAEEAAKKSQEITKEAAKKSQELTKGAAKLSQEFVSETAKKSKELAVEASKKADKIKIEALKRADQIKTLAGEIEIPIPISPIKHLSSQEPATEEATEDELERFGVTDELREFVKGITISTFRDFPMEDEPEISEVPTVSNVRQDLNVWQAKHATIVLSTVKEISRFRYELCPRYMKERKFWRIYFVLVNSYVSLCEKQYMENLKVEKIDREQNDGAKKSSNAAPTPAAETKVEKLQCKTSTAEHDLDVFLLGDLGSDDEGPDEGDDGFNDDFDNIESNSGLESDEDASGNKSKQSK